MVICTIRIRVHGQGVNRYSHNVGKFSKHETRVLIVYFLDVLLLVIRVIRWPVFKFICIHFFFPSLLLEANTSNIAEIGKFVRIAREFPSTENSKGYERQRRKRKRPPNRSHSKFRAYEMHFLRTAIYSIMKTIC